MNCCRFSPALIASLMLAGLLGLAPPAHAQTELLGELKNRPPTR